MKQEIDSILIALRSSITPFGKYPIGNKELTEKVKALEAQGLLAYDKYNDTWVKPKTKRGVK